MSIDPASPQRTDPIDALAHQTGFSPEAVEAMRRSVARGGGRMAQFDHREFGGAGQWMRGGMLMIGDPSNHELKRRIDSLCDALSQSLGDQQHGSSTGHQWQSQTVGAAGIGHRVEQSSWYPASLGAPDTSGSQNDLRYAWFAPQRRLAVDRNGVVTLYDTGDHRISGVSQQQGSGQKLAFASQHGDLDLDRLPIVGGEPPEHRGERDDHDAGEPVASPVPPAPSTAIDPFVALEKLAELHARGILDADEFAGKKRELLQRI